MRQQASSRSCWRNSARADFMEPLGLMAGRPAEREECDESIASECGCLEEPRIQEASESQVSKSARPFYNARGRLWGTRREISRVLVLNLSGEKAVLRHGTGYSCLDRAFSLIGGAPGLTNLNGRSHQG